MSLNHAVLPSTNTSFAQELMDQQGAAAALAAHAEYFTRPYAYAKFFRPRAHVLHAYASAIGVRQLPPVANWTAINRRCSLYIEAFPTRSPKFALPPLGPAPAALQSSVFVCALNAIVHDIVLRLLRPRCVLLAGKASWHGAKLRRESCPSYDDRPGRRRLPKAFSELMENPRYRTTSVGLPFGGLNGLGFLDP